ncbi:MAG: glycoside hydrolase family 13 protein [Chitinophagaceae bacterium]
MNWWVGMKDQNLQLLVYGENISELTPQIKYPGVVIKKINKADSKNYLFLDLLIAKNTKPGSFDIQFRKENELTCSQSFSLLPRSFKPREMKGFSAPDVIYLITPDRFVNGDKSNDIIKGMLETTIDRKDGGGRHGGDIRGMIKSLDYIAEMGYTAIWPTPLLENNMRRNSYHGYAITDHYKVDPRFGTMDDYKELAVKARQKGLKLIFDGVANHTGSNYWWMQDLPYKNWLNFPETKQVTNHRRTVNMDPYAADYDKIIMTRGWFVTSMPDLNHQNPFLANYLIQNNIWWIETLGLSGIRQDTYPYSEKEFLKKWSCRIMSEYPAFSIVGEEWSYNPAIAAYWQQGQTNKDGYTNCLKSSMDFPLQVKLTEALTEPETWDKGLVKIYEALANDFIYNRPNDLLIFGDNHDMDRLFTQLNKDVDLMQIALTYLLTMRGIPQLYYGTEVLLDNTGFPGHHGVIRSDFPGGWEKDTANTFTKQNLSANQLRMQQFLKKVLNWRKNKAVIHSGKTMHFAPDHGTYVYCRYNDKETVMVLINKNNAETTIKTERFAEIIKTKKTGIDILNGKILKIDDSIIVPAKTALILELK